MTLVPTFIRTALRRFRHAKDGVAAIEFAILSSAFLVVMLTGLQFHAYNNSRVQLNKAVNTGMITAFNTRDTIDSEHIKTIIKSQYGRDLQDLSVTCTAPANQGESSDGNSSSSGEQTGQACTNMNRSCACVTGYNNATPIFTSSPCDQLCSSGTLAGYYLTIDGKAPVPTVFNNTFMLPSDVSANVTIRLD